MTPLAAAAPRGIVAGAVLGMLSALLLGLFERLECAWLGFFALVPWLLAIETSRKHAVISSFLLTAGSVAIAFPWLVTAASSYGNIPTGWGWTLLILGSVLLQPQFVIAGLVRGRVARICTYLAVEALYPKLLGDTLGQGLYPLASFRQLAAVGGVSLLTLLLLMTSELLAESIRHRKRGPFVVASLVMLSPLMLPSPERAVGSTGIEVAAVQSNLTRYDQVLHAEGSAALMDRVLLTHARLHRDATDPRANHPVAQERPCGDARVEDAERCAARRPSLVVWGEAVYPTTFGHPKSEPGRETDEALREIIRAGRTPVLFGGYDVGEFNAAFLVDAEGKTLDVYRKSKLVPFGEFIPMGALWSALGLVNGPTSWGRGDGPRTFALGSLRIQPLICYEALFPEMTRDTDADLLVVLSNDGWFDSELQARQHLAVSAFRSVETGRPQLRVANSGLTSIIDSQGQVVSGLSANLPGVLRAEIPTSLPRRPLIWWPAPCLLLAFLFGRQRLRRFAPSARMNCAAGGDSPPDAFTV